MQLSGFWERSAVALSLSCSFPYALNQPVPSADSFRQSPNPAKVPTHRGLLKPVSRTRTTQAAHVASVVGAAQVERQGDAAITTVLLRLAREATKPAGNSASQLSAIRADSRFKRLAALVAATVWRMAPRELATTLYSYALLNHSLDVSLQVLSLGGCPWVTRTNRSWSSHRCSRRAERADHAPCTAGVTSQSPVLDFSPLLPSHNGSTWASALPTRCEHSEMNRTASSTRWSDVML